MTKKIQFSFFLMLIACAGFAQDIWLKKTSFEGSARSKAVSFSIDSLGFVGLGNDGDLKNDFWSYDSKSDTWTQIADFEGTAREQAVAFTLEGKGYVGTGLDATDETNDFWQYDPETNDWIQKNNFTGSAREGAVATTLNGKGYVAFGRNGSAFFADVWEYDPAGDAWTEIEGFTGDGRVGAFAFGISGKLYVGNGYNYDGGSIATNDVWEYDPVSGLWKEKEIFTGTLTDGNTYFSLKNKGYFLTSASNGKFYEYDPSKDEWTEKLAFGETGNNNRYDATAFVIDTIGYVATGFYAEDFFTGNNTNDLWLYSPSFSVPAVPANISSKVLWFDSVEVKWNDVSDNEVGFELWRRHMNDSYQILATLPADTTRYNDTTTIAGSYYYYKVKALGALKDSDFSYQIYVRVPDSLEVPTDLKASGLGPHRVNLEWRDQSVDEEGFIIERSIGNNTAYVAIDSVGAGIVSFSDTGLMEGGLYFYRIRAYGDEKAGEHSVETSAVPVEGGSWVRKNDLPGITRFGAVNLVIEGKVYYGLGYSYGSDMRDMWQYDPVQDVWTQVADFEGGSRYYQNSFVIGSKGYVGMGTKPASNWEKYADFWEFDPQNNGWVQKGDFQGTPRHGAVNFVIGNKAYVGFGDDPSMKDFWAYDPTDDSWTQVADCPSTANNVWIGTALSLEGKGYVFDINTQGYVYEYDPVADNWQQKAKIPYSNQSATGFVLDGKLYLCTGTSSENQVWEYTPSLDTWTRKADFNGPGREKAVSFVVDGHAYIGSGSGYNTNLKDLWMYDPSAPTLPTDLAVELLNDSTTFLQWTDNSGIETGFVVERSADNTSGFVTIASFGANVTAYQDEGLSENTRYYYRVKAIAGNNHSAYSNEVMAKTPGRPSAPTDLLLEEITAFTIKLRWTDRADNEDGFVIERAMSNESNYELVDTVDFRPDYNYWTTYQDKDLISNTYYYYRIHAFNSYGASGYAKRSVFTKRDRPLAVSDLVAVARSNSEIQLNWTDNSSNESGFIIMRSNASPIYYVPIDTVEANGTNYKDTGLEEDVQYYYSVYAYNKDGYEVGNEAQATTILYPPNAPTELMVSGRLSLLVELSWLDNSGTEEGYIIERSPNSGSGFEEFAELDADAQSYSYDVATSNELFYYYRVKAFNSAGHSEYSSISQAEVVTGLGRDRSDGFLMYEEGRSLIIDVYSAPDELSTVHIFDLMGAKVFEVSLLRKGRNRFELNALKSGFYIAKVGIGRSETTRKIYLKE